MYMRYKKAIWGLGAVLYLLFGVWFGSLNLKVQQNPEQYGYVAHHLLFPIVTIGNAGWLCSSADKETCLIQRLPAGRQKAFPLHFAKEGLGFDVRKTEQAYVTFLTLLWPLKVVANAAVLLLLYVTTLLFKAAIVVFIFIVFLFGGLIYILVSLFHLLL